MPVSFRFLTYVILAPPPPRQATTGYSTFFLLFSPAALFYRVVYLRRSAQLFRERASTEDRTSEKTVGEQIKKQRKIHHIREEGKHFFTDSRPTPLVDRQ